MKQKERKKEIKEKKKEINYRLIKDIAIRDIRTLFCKKKIIINQKEQAISIIMIILNMKVMMIDESISLDEYLNKTELYMMDIIIDLQKFDTWKINLTIAINFISSTDSGKERIMDSKSDNIKFKSYNDVNEVVNELIDSLCSRYQINLET